MHGTIGLVGLFAKRDDLEEPAIRADRDSFALDGRLPAGKPCHRMARDQHGPGFTLFADAGVPARPRSRGIHGASSLKRA